MRLVSLQYLVLFLIGFSCGYQLNVWPHPSFFQENAAAPLSLSSTSFRFRLVTPATQTELLKNAFERYFNLIFWAGNRLPSSNLTPLNELKVYVKTLNAPLVLGFDENYNLSISPNGTASLNANTEYGVIRGLETFYQLTEWTPQRGYSLSSSDLLIKDEPRFQWRSLLLDTARHYMAPSTILQTLDTMSYSKFNVLHWHITDDESFPLQSLKFPLLSEKGSWAPKAIYNQTFVKYVVEYARQRAIRVVPEFDLPGHTRAWGRAYPFLLTSCATKYRATFNPINEKVYDFLEQFLSEMSTIFTDEYIHIGGDEVSYSCWSSNPEIVAYLAQKNMSMKQLQNYFSYRVQLIVQKLKKTAILWQESFDHNDLLLPSTVIENWINVDNFIKILNSGRRTLQSAGFYLDRQQPIPPEVNYLWGDTWVQFYNNDPFGQYNISKKLESLAVGGGACQWAEQVDDFSIETRMWPRAGAIGERMWSPRQINNSDEALPRLIRWRCTLLRRGIHAHPIRADWCWTPQNIQLA